MNPVLFHTKKIKEERKLKTVFFTSSYFNKEYN